MDEEQPAPFVRERNFSRRFSKNRRVSTESNSSVDDSLSRQSSSSSSSLQFSYSVNSQSESLAIKARSFAKMEQHQNEVQRIRTRILQMNSQSEPSLVKLQQRMSLEEIERTPVRQLRQKFEGLGKGEQIVFKTPNFNNSNPVMNGWRLHAAQMDVNASINEVASEDEVDDISDSEVVFEPCVEEVELPPPPPSSSPPKSTPPLSREQSVNEEVQAVNIAVLNSFNGQTSGDDEIEQGVEVQVADDSTPTEAIGVAHTNSQKIYNKKRAQDFQSNNDKEHEKKHPLGEKPRNYRTTPRPKTEVIDTTTGDQQLLNRYKSYHQQEEDEKEEAVLRQKHEASVFVYVQPILDELIKTEETYVENLLAGIKNYGNIFSRKDLPLGLRGKKFVLLGNIEQIAEFHRDEFLPMLLRNKDDLKRLFEEFSIFIEENCFYGYVLYTMNKQRSLKLCESFKDYFKRLQAELDDKLGINSFLVQPIQRMARYPLLLQQFITKLFKHRDFNFKPVIEACCRVDKKIRTLLTMTNESEVINDIVECNDFNVFYQGKFRKVSEFHVFDHTLRRTYRSKVFIFDKCIVYTEIKDKRLVFRGCYPCERIGIIAKQKSFTLFYQRRKTQECDFITDQNQCEEWLELITEMISSFASEERRKLKEMYSKENDHAHRRPPSLSLFRNSNRFSADSGIGNMWTLPKNIDETKEEGSKRTTWYHTS